MKKSLIALAAVAVSGAAFAQSSVTVFGVVDQAVSYVNGGENWNGINSGANSTSRLGFRGVEDLGGGLKAGFWLEGEVFGDNGNANGFNFQRRSTVSLMGGFGEVRMGRELTPGYSKTSSYDLFGQTGIGQFMGWSNWNGSTGDANGVRSSNMISYYTPNFSGFNAGLGYGFDEQVTGKAGRYIGGYVAYDNGPLSVAVSYDERSLAANVDRNAITVGASYNMNVVKLNAIVQQTKDDVVGTDPKVNAYSLGVSAPMGAGEVKLQYSLYDQKAIDSKAHQLSLGYVHNLSKRTAVYGTVSYMDNKDRSNLGLAAKNLNTAGPGAGESQTGVQVGVRHSF